MKLSSLPSPFPAPSRQLAWGLACTIILGVMCHWGFISLSHDSDSDSGNSAGSRAALKSKLGSIPDSGPVNKGLFSSKTSSALAGVHAPGDESSAIALQNHLNELGATDPEQLPAFLDTLPEGSIKVTAVLQSLETLASGEHPDHLVAGILTQVEADVLPQAWIAVGVGKAKRNPQEAMAWAMTLPDPVASDSCALQVAQQWATTDAAAALQWLDQAETGPNWDELLQVIAAGWASVQPDQAKRWAEQQAAADPDSSSITSIVERVVAGQQE